MHQPTGRFRPSPSGASAGGPIRRLWGRASTLLALGLLCATLSVPSLATAFNPARTESTTRAPIVQTTDRSTRSRGDDSASAANPAYRRGRYVIPALIFVLMLAVLGFTLLTSTSNSSR